MGLVRTVLDYALSAMTFIILASVVISWLRATRVRISYSNPVIRAIEEISEYILRPIRRAMPTAGGGLDFSPMIALILLYILRQIVAQIL